MRGPWLGGARQARTSTPACISPMRACSSAASSSRRLSGSGEAGVRMRVCGLRLRGRSRLRAARSNQWAGRPCCRNDSVMDNALYG